MKAIVLAGSKGIGKGISDKLNEITEEIVVTSSSDLDTSDISQVKDFVKSQNIQRRQRLADRVKRNTSVTPPPDEGFINQNQMGE